MNKKNIQSIEDLKGKSFVFGAAGSATEVESKLVFKAHGIEEGDIKGSYVGFTEATDLMRNGQVDGVNIFSGVPSAATTELISTLDTKVLNLSEDAIKELVENYPWNFKYVIEANT